MFFGRPACFIRNPINKPKFLAAAMGYLPHLIPFYYATPVTMAANAGSHKNSTNDGSLWFGQTKMNDGQFAVANR
jgi:hypothetical protein